MTRTGELHQGQRSVDFRSARGGVVGMAGRWCKGCAWWVAISPHSEALAVRHCPVQAILPHRGLASLAPLTCGNFAMSVLASCTLRGEALNAAAASSRARRSVCGNFARTGGLPSFTCGACCRCLAAASNISIDLAAAMGRAPAQGRCRSPRVQGVRWCRRRRSRRGRSRTHIYETVVLYK